MEAYDTSIQHLTVHRFLAHNYMEDMIPSYLKDLETIKLQHSVFSSVREGIRDHLVGIKQSKLVMAKDILCTFASSSEVGSGRWLAGLLGVDRRNISRARGRRLLLDSGQNAFWLHYRCKVWCNILPDHVKVAVELWWSDETTVSPNRKDVCTFHEGHKQWSSHPTHFLKSSQVPLYMRNPKCL
jgi:hypothetical protein